MSYSREILEKFISQIEVNAESVLDVGGSQKPIKGRTKTWDVKDYKILDLGIPHQGNKPDIVCDLNNENGIPELYDSKEKFEAIFCFEVSEYLLNPILVFTALAYSLKIGGKLYASFHFNYPVHNPVDKDYLRYTEAGIKEIFKRAGLEIIDLKYREWEEPYWWNQAIRLDRMRPAKDYQNHNATGFLVVATKK
jgi:hypothetical protein